MGDEHDLAHPGRDGGGGVADVEHERAPAHAGAVDVGGRDAEVLRDSDRALAGAGDAVDLRLVDAAVGDGVAGGVGVKTDGGQVRDAPELGRLGGADDGDLALECRSSWPAPRRAACMSPRTSKVTVQRHVEHERLRRLLDAGDVAHHARTLVELDDSDRIGRLEPGCGSMIDHVGVQRAPTAHRLPFDGIGEARRAEGAGWEVEASRRRTCTAAGAVRRRRILPRRVRSRATASVRPCAWQVQTCSRCADFQSLD